MGEAVDLVSRFKEASQNNTRAPNLRRRFQGSGISYACTGMFFAEIHPKKFSQRGISLQRTGTNMHHSLNNVANVEWEIMFEGWL
jgi:hypothetical protein